MPTIIDRTWRVQIFTDLGTDPRIEFLRERVKTYEDGDVLRTTLPTAARSLSAIAAQTLPGGPRKITTYGELAAIAAQTLPGGPRKITTYGELAAVISECGHAIAAEDVAALAAAAEKAAKAAAKKPAADSVAVGG